MKIRSIDKNNFFIPKTFLGNDKLPEKEKLKVNYKRRPTAGEIGTFSKNYYKDGLFIQDRDDRRAVKEYVESIENLEVDDKKLTTADSLLDSQITAFSLLITLIANDLLIADDFEMGEE